MKSVKYLILFFLTIAVITKAQDKNYVNEPGYAEFGDLTKLSYGEGKEVQVDANLLKMVAKMSDENDPELRTILNQIKLIRVNSFKVTDKNERSVNLKIAEIDKQLLADKWNRIVKVKEGKETANVYIINDGSGEMTGLAVTAIDKQGEAAFINIVGKLDFETLGKLGQQFDIPNLDSLKGGKGKK